MASLVDNALSNPIVRGTLTGLAIQDTVHDFWDGGRGEANPITEESLKNFRKTINTLSTRLLPGNTMTSITLNEISLKNERTPDEWINKPSNYERNLIRKYEEQFPGHLYSKTKDTITYQDILKNGEALKKKYLKNRGYCNILSIIPAEGQYFDSLDMPQRNTVANFILSFMFATETDQNIGTGPYGITYDAGPVAPRKVFADIEQMYNYIYPQNITDSAATSFKSKKIRYVFPSDPATPGVSLVRSNIFTQPNNLKISFVNTGYTALNRYAFKWRFEAPGGLIEIPFGPGQSDGPSVNYLVTSMINGGPASDKAFREKKTIVDISKLQPLYTLNSGIILDLKRSGDFEQVHASLNDQEVIFATIDHLCSFYARMLHKPCIWSNNASSEIVLYRFERGPPPSDAERLKMEVSFFAQEQVDRIKFLATLVDGTPERTSIIQALQEFQKGQTAYFLTQSKDSPAQIPFINNPGGYANIIGDVNNQGYLADALTTAFLRLKCKDTAEYIAGLQKALSEQARLTQPADYYLQNAEVLKLLISEPELFVVTSTPTGSTISFKGKPTGPPPTQGIEGIVSGLKGELERYKDLIDIQTAGQLFYKKLFGTVGVNVIYDHKANNPTFEFSSGHFKSIHTAFRAMIGILTTNRAGRDRGKKAFGFLTEYYTARDALLNTFRNKEVAEQIRNASDINVAALTVGDDPATIATFGNRAIQMVQVMFTGSLPAATGGQGRRQKSRRQKKRRLHRTKRAFKGWKKIKIHQYGGVPNPSIGQANDLSLLFRDICGKAAAYVESVISELLEKRKNQELATINTKQIADGVVLQFPGVMDAIRQSQTSYQSQGIAYPQEVGYAVAQQFITSQGPNAIAAVQNMINANIQQAQAPIVQKYSTDTAVPIGEILGALTAYGAADILADIQLHWETELIRIRENADDDYGVPYLPTMAEDFITMLLSRYSGKEFRTYSLFTPDRLNEYSEYKRDAVMYNDFWRYVLTGTNEEARTLVFLTIFDNMLTEKYPIYLNNFTPPPPARRTTFSYSAPAEWNERLPNDLKDRLFRLQLTLNPELHPIRSMGGGRRPLYNKSTSP